MSLVSRDESALFTLTGEAASPQAELWLRKLNSALKHSLTHVSQTDGGTSSSRCTPHG